MRRFPRRALLAAIPLLLGACESAGQAPPQTPTPSAVGPLVPSEPFGVTSVTLRSPDGSVGLSVPVYDAYEPEARQRGLMHRDELPAGTGMVFRFPAPRTGGFWMKNTLIPLSIAYFDRDGEVVEVLDMAPCRADPCPTYPAGARHLGALEVNQGFFDDVGLRPGWRIELPPGLPPPG